MGTIVITPAITSVGIGAFYNTGITAVDLTEGLIVISDAAFYTTTLAGTVTELPLLSEVPVKVSLDHLDSGATATWVS